MIDENLVRSVAHLARIAIPEARVPGLAKELAHIVEYVDQLAALDVQGVAPLTHTNAGANVYREDEVAPSLPVEAVMALAPARSGNFYRVPKVIGDA